MDPPSELFLSILVRCSARVVVRVASLVSSLQKNKIFWTNYLNHLPEEQQERLHQLFVCCAENERWTIFKYLWRTDLLAKDRKKFIKERRSLLQSFERAYLNGHEETAWKIFVIERSWMLRHFNIAKGLQTPITTQLKVVECRMSMWVAARWANYERFKNNYEQISGLLKLDTYIKMVNNYYRYHVMMMQTLAAESDSYEFLAQVIENLPVDDYVDCLNALIIQLLKLGKYELAVRVITRYSSNKWTHWHYLLQSNRSDSLKIMAEHGTIIDNEGTIVHNITNVSDCLHKLGNADILIEYMKKYPLRAHVLLDSYATLPAEQFIQLYLSITKKLPELEELSDNGYDHLIELFFARRVPTIE